MLTTTKTTLFVFASLTLATAAFGSDASDARRSIENAYKRIDVAVTRRDSRTLLSFMKPEYKLTMAGKTLSKANMSRNMSVLFSTAKTLKTKTSIQKFVFSGSRATVIGQEFAEATAVSRSTHTLKTVKINSIFEEVWMKEKGRWLKQKTRNLHLQQIVDGRSIKPVIAK
jgi:hypothetical protein